MYGSNGALSSQPVAISANVRLRYNYRPDLITTDFREWNTQGQIIVIFHDDAAYLVLNDESYNQNRHAHSGNRYKDVLNGLMQKGLQLELCGATATANHWGNENLLPGIKVNVNAMVRLAQLEQQGYTLIYQ